MKKALILICGLAVTGCASGQIAIMQNQKTGETVKCQPDPYYLEWEPWKYQEQLEQCVSGYEKAGYVRVDTPPNSKAP